MSNRGPTAVAAAAGVASGRGEAAGVAGVTAGASGWPDPVVTSTPTVMTAIPTPAASVLRRLMGRRKALCWMPRTLSISLGSVSYHDGMQRVELLMVGLAAISMLAVFGSSLGRLGRSARLSAQLVLGGACGLLAGIVVLVLTIDLVPDPIEAAVGPWVYPVLAVAVAGGALVLRAAYRRQQSSIGRKEAQ
jgi:hypothetical protein